MNINLLLKSALAGALTLGVASIATAAGAPAPGKGMPMGNMAKCYGINAAHKNDCKSPGHSCAGQDAKARDPAAFVAVPTGLCEKIGGGSLTPTQG